MLESTQFCQASQPPEACVTRVDFLGFIGQIVKHLMAVIRTKWKPQTS